MQNPILRLMLALLIVGSFVSPGFGVNGDSGSASDQKPSRIQSPTADKTAGGKVVGAWTGKSPFGDMVSLMLSADGTLVDHENNQGEYIVSGSKITIKLPDKCRFEGTIKGNTITGTVVFLGSNEKEQMTFTRK